MLTYSKFQKIKLEFLFINKFCAHAVLRLSKSFRIPKIVVLWLSKSLVIQGRLKEFSTRGSKYH